MGMTANELVAAVNRRCGWASTNGPLADSASSETHEAAVLALANEELVGDAYPLVKASHGSYYLTSKSYDIVAGQRFYRLPDRAYGGVTDVCWVDSDGKEGPSLGAIDLEDVPQLHWSATASGDPLACRYWLDGDRLGLHPTPSTTSAYILRVKFMMHPSRLALTTSALVAPLETGSVSWAAGSLTLETVDATQFFPAINGTGDIVSSGNAHATLLADGFVTNRVSNVFTIAATVNPNVAATDYFCSPGYTPIVQLPDFMLPYFVRRVAAAALMAQGDRPGAGAELQAAAQLYEKAQSTASPRNAAEPRTLITRNSPLRQRGGLFWGR